MAKFKDKERILKAAREKQEVRYKGAPIRLTTEFSMRNAKNIPSNENQRPSTKATIPSKPFNQDRRPNKELPRQTRSARDAKGKEGKEKERGTQVGKNGNE